MKTLYEKSFGRDLKKIKDKRLLKQAQKIIAQVEAAASLTNRLAECEEVGRLHDVLSYQGR